MQARQEQVFVGLFVVIAAILLVITVFALAGVFATSTHTFHARFHNAAGLEPGASVRFEGGPKVGRVESLSIVPTDPSLMDLAFSVKGDVPVKTDSHASIMSFSPLGDNHMEIRAGSLNAPKAADGALLPSDPYVGFNDLTAEINELTPQAKQLLTNLNDRITQLKVTIDRVDDLLNDRNRANISATLDNLHGMLQENRPQIKSTINNVNNAAQKLNPLLDQIHHTVEQADGTLKKVDGMLDENRGDVRASVVKLHESLDNVAALTNQVQRLLDDNDYNIGEILNNMRIVSENLKEFTDSIKTHPASLLNPAMPRDRKPGEKP